MLPLVLAWVGIEWVSGGCWDQVMADWVFWFRKPRTWSTGAYVSPVADWMESLNVLLVFTQLSPACLRGQPIVQNQTRCSGAKWLVEESLTSHQLVKREEEAKGTGWSGATTQSQGWFLALGYTGWWFGQDRDITRAFWVGVSSGPSLSSRSLGWLKGPEIITNCDDFWIECPWCNQADRTGRACGVISFHTVGSENSKGHCQTVCSTDVVRTRVLFLYNWCIVEYTY